MPYPKAKFAGVDIDPAPIYYVVVRCPVKSCRNSKCPVVSTRGLHRWHKCSECGFWFKSLEKELSDLAPVE